MTAPTIFPTRGADWRLNALPLALASQLAYLPEDNVAQECRLSGATYFRWIESTGTGTQGFVATDGQVMIVVFRGTDNLRDWLTDLDVRMVDFAGMKLHEGFVNAHKSVSCQVASALLGSDSFKVPIYFAGHSLGGALAMLSAFAYPQAAGVFTFGQPRVGGKSFQFAYDTELKSRTWRFVHEEDIVPRVPWLLGRYRHAGKEVLLDSLGCVDEEPSVWRKLLSDAVGIGQAFYARKVAGLDKVVKDHSMTGYIERLK